MADAEHLSNEYVARFIEDHSDELVVLLRDRFRLEYPNSDSGAMKDSELDVWSATEITEFCQVIRGAIPEIRRHDVYEGDTGQNLDDLIQPITVFIEGRLFIARTIASFIWRHLDAPIQEKEAAFSILDAAVLRIIRENILSFVENELLCGSVMRTWDFSAKRTSVHGARSPRSAGKEARQPALTEREEEIARLVTSRRTNGEIAAALGLSQSTVKNRLVRIFDKLGVNTRAELASHMTRRDLV